MSKRIKVTGYLNPEDMDPSEVDLDHETGLSELGTERVTSIFGDITYKVCDLEDITTEVVED